MNDAGALSMSDLSNPDIDLWAFAQGMGVEAMRATTIEEFNDQHCLMQGKQGSARIEAII